jgi:hypothetical protein
MNTSDEECAQLKKTLNHPERVECHPEGEITLWLNLDGLKIDEALEILDDVRSEVRKHAGKPVRLRTSGTIDLY